MHTLHRKGEKKTKGKSAELKNTAQKYSGKKSTLRLRTDKYFKKLLYHGRREYKNSLVTVITPFSQQQATTFKKLLLLDHDKR